MAQKNRLYFISLFTIKPTSVTLAFMKLLDKLANLAVIIVAIIAVAIFVRGGRQQQPTQDAPRAAMERTVAQLKGTKIDLPGAGLDVPGLKKVVLSLSVGCHYCEQSAPFYQKLRVLSENGVKFKLVAALPQEKELAEAYLKVRKVQVDVLASSRPILDRGVSPTPTLLIVGDSGVVEQVWVGLLSEAGQREVLAKLGAG
jgi:thiol-disulfide isomerase/thioredoxin